MPKDTAKNAAHAAEATADSATESASETDANGAGDALANVTPLGPLAEVMAIVQSIPQVDDDPTARMIAYIMAAPPEEWESLWDKLPNVKDNAGRQVRVFDIRARESDFKGKLPVYLICDVTWMDSGENGLLSVSSEISMVQLLRLYKDKRLPATLEIVKKAKATAKGFHPIHLRYLDKTQAATGDPTLIVSEQ